MAAHREVSRRQLLAGTLAALGTIQLAGCATATGAPGTVHTVSGLLAESPFYIAHRGSGDNWTEHTLQAYSAAADQGMKAIEVSVNATSDGVLICNHDATLLRLGADPRKVSEVASGELAGIRQDARAWLGPAAEPQPVALLREVLDQFAATHVIFLEDKQGTNTDALLDLMDSYPDAGEHFVWKQGSRSTSTDAVRARGYRIWGYFDADERHLFDALVPQLDLVGLNVAATDEVFTELVAHGKPVIAWEVHLRSVRDRLLALGVRGMMCSNVIHVCSSEALDTRDRFGSGLRAAGDLPWVLDKGWNVQPALDAGAGTLRISSNRNASYLMGSLGPVRSPEHSIGVEMRWPDWLPPDPGHAGVAFGQDGDAPYRVHFPSTVSGYHLVLRTNGELALFSRAAGTTEGTRLAAVATAPVRAGEWVGLEIGIDPGRIGFGRTGDPAWRTEVADASYRGGYLSLCKNYVVPMAVEFRNVVIG